MKQMVINKYDEVFMVMGEVQNQTSMGTYPSVEDALNGMSKFFESTTWSEKVEKVSIYGVITESNGYKHCSKEPIFTATTKQFWGGHKPEIHEIKKAA